MENIWHKLYDYESRDLIERFIEKRYKRKASARQVAEISSNFIQAREFFRNADNSNLSVKPLLLYYGVNSLSRGLVLLLNPHISESSLKPSHGLDTINWRQTISENKLSNLTVEIKNGGFYELLTTTQNKSYFKFNTSGVNWKVEYPIPSVDNKFTLDDLIKIIPDLLLEYNKWKDEDLQPIKIKNFKGNELQHKYSIDKFKIDSFRIVDIFGKGISSNIHVNEMSDCFEVTTPLNVWPQFSQSINQNLFGIGDIMLTKTINGMIYLNSLSQLYCLSFFLGMLSRYFPSYWININKTEKGDAIYPLFLKSIELIIQEFPKLTYEFLEGPYDFENP